jgi:hypothetical protein
MSVELVPEDFSVADHVMNAAAAILLCRVVVGDQYSAGAYTPAVADEEHPWCVQDRRGTVLVLATDIFQAALWFVRLEHNVDSFRDIVGGEEGPLVLESDAAMARRKAEDRRHEILNGWWN